MHLLSSIRNYPFKRIKLEDRSEQPQIQRNKYIPETSYSRRGEDRMFWGQVSQSVQTDLNKNYVIKKRSHKTG